MSNNLVVSVSNFKSHCLEYIENASSEYFEYTVTKRNKPVARLIPVEDDTFHFGQLKGTAMIKGDIMASIDVDWETTL